MTLRLKDKYKDRLKLVSIFNNEVVIIFTICDFQFNGEEIACHRNSYQGCFDTALYDSSVYFHKEFGRYKKTYFKGRIKDWCETEEMPTTLPVEKATTSEARILESVKKAVSDELFRITDSYQKRLDAAKLDVQKVLAVYVIRMWLLSFCNYNTRVLVEDNESAKRFALLDMS